MRGSNITKDDNAAEACVNAIGAWGGASNFTSTKLDTINNLDTLNNTNITIFYVVANTTFDAVQIDIISGKNEGPIATSTSYSLYVFQNPGIHPVGTLPTEMPALPYAGDVAADYAALIKSHHEGEYTPTPFFLVIRFA